jgi:hypothetical protein
MFVPAKYKDCYTTFILNELAGSTCMVGVLSCFTWVRCDRVPMGHSLLATMRLSMHEEMGEMLLCRFSHEPASPRGNWPSCCEIW